MKKNMKFVSILLTAVLAVGATAVAASADEDAVFKIGAIGPMTGGAAQYGLAVVNAAELAVKEINENGAKK